MMACLTNDQLKAIFGDLEKSSGAALDQHNGDHRKKRLGDDLGMDSLDFIEFIANVESDLGFESDWVPDRKEIDELTVGDVIARIEKEIIGGDGLA